MSQEAAFRFRMSEAKLRMRSGTRTGAANRQRARRRLISTWLMISLFVVAAIAVYAYSLT